MLVLSRKVGQKIRIGDDVEITVNRIAGNRVSLGILAPRNVRVARGETTAEGGAPIDIAPSVNIDISQGTTL